MEYYNYIKSLHLIFVITWFAGLFYEPRLFIYHIEASKKNPPEKDILEKQLKIMSRRLWYFIAWPSAILASTSFAIIGQEPANAELVNSRIDKIKVNFFIIILLFIYI